MKLTHDSITSNFDDETIRLYHESMQDPNIVGNVDNDDITHDHIRRWIDGTGCHRVLLDGKVIGVFNPQTVHISCYFDFGLERGIIYDRIGFIYIDKDYRNKGYATAILKEFIDKSEHFVECCNEDNLASKAMLSKVLTFKKRYRNIYRGEYQLVFIK